MFLFSCTPSTLCLSIVNKTILLPYLLFRIKVRSSSSGATCQLCQNPTTAQLQEHKVQNEKFSEKGERAEEKVRGLNYSTVGLKENCT